MKTAVKKYKEDLKTILEVLIFGIIILLLFSFKSSTTSILVLCLFGIILCYGIYTKILRRKRRHAIFLIPAKNDVYYKSTYIISGIIAIAVSLFFIFYFNNLDSIKITVIVMGIILLVNGLVWLPGEELVIQNKQLVLSGRISHISLDELIAVTIQTDKIILETNQPHKMIIQHFNIDRQTAINLQNYLSKHMEKYPNVVIKNNVN